MDKGVLIALPVVAVIGAFWFLILSPKRQEASDLKADVAALQASVDEKEAVATAAEASRETFPQNYRRLVVLGKAVPEDADSSSLLVQLSELSRRSNVSFKSLHLAKGSGTAPAPTTEPITPAAAAEESEQQVAAAESGAPAVPVATEASVAALPLGATVGPAGLPVMPYELTFSGDFFAIANFIGAMDQQVGLREDGQPSVVGRLLTIDGFSLSLGEDTTGGPFDPLNPTIQAEFAVTTFVTPPGEGVTAGATPAGPPPTEPQPVSSDGTAAPSPTATVGATP